MTKSDLKTGMKVKLRNNTVYLIVKDCDTPHNGHQDFCLIRKGGYMIGSDYNEDLTIEDSGFDIMKIYNRFGTINSDTFNLNVEKYDLIWERSNK